MSLARVVYTTIDEYLKGEVPLTFRKRLALGMMFEKNRVTYDHSGTQHDWRPRVFQNEPQGATDGTTVDFPQVNRHRQATLGWRGYVMAESITKMEQLKNKGQQALIPFVQNMARYMMEDFRDYLDGEFFTRDGNAAGSELLFHGLPSMSSVSGVTAITSTAAVGTNNDTYAGIGTALATLGGTWTGTWPEGYGDSEYDAWTPFVADFNDTAWTGTATWASAGPTVLRYCIHQLQKNAMHAATVFLARAMWTTLLNTVDDSERITVQPGARDNDLIKLGFTNVVNIDGTDVCWQFGIPANTGWGICWDSLELMSMQNQLLVTEKDYALESFSKRFALDCYGNWKFNPRDFFNIISN